MRWSLSTRASFLSFSSDMAFCIDVAASLRRRVCGGVPIGRPLLNAKVSRNHQYLWRRRNTGYLFVINHARKTSTKWICTSVGFATNDSRYPVIPYICKYGEFFRTPPLLMIGTKAPFGGRWLRNVDMLSAMGDASKRIFTPLAINVSYDCAG